MNTSLRLLTALGVSATALLTQPAQALDVGVSIGISQPGVYGRIDIGRYPQPVLVQPRPVVVMAPATPVEPIYMWVPPGHQRHWHRHCATYGACGVPVYFVQDQWYQRQVARPVMPAPVYQPAPPVRYEPRYEPPRPEPRYEPRYEPEMRRRDPESGGRSAPRYEERRGNYRSQEHGRDHDRD